MAYLCVDPDGEELIFSNLPKRGENEWEYSWFDEDCISLPHGSIAKLIGRELTWSDEPVKIE